MPSMTPGRPAALSDVLAAGAGPFALLHRRGPGGRGRVEILLGDVITVPTLADLPLPDLGDEVPANTHDLLAVVPYRQISERGFACRDDHAPLLALEVRAQGTASTAEALRVLPDEPADLTGAGFDIDDDAYADLVRRVLADEIGQGAGANFVIRRSFTGRLDDWSGAVALTLFRRLLGQELGAYWTFVVYTGAHTFVGATPERHVSLHDGTVVMNPISGTYRYPPGGPSVPGLLRFLADRKESDELFMVVDEELKMIGGLSTGGGRVLGPYLREMTRLAHTEYLLEAQSTLDVREVLRETMFAPTVTGSPLANACRVISRYEPGGRGWYSGTLALIGRSGRQRTLDSAILIRTAEIDRAGRVRIGVGATLVRHSDPDAEVAETQAKAAGLLAAFGTRSAAAPARPPALGHHPAVRRALAGRNAGLAQFWLDRPRRTGTGPLTGARILVLDAEDAFTAMLGHQIRALGADVTIQRYDAPWDATGRDIVLLGPGPGDPRDTADPRIAALRAAAGRLLAAGVPVLGVCLGHQILGAVLGLDLVRRDRPNQGVRREIDFFGRTRRVGFYNSFALTCASAETTGIAGPLALSRDPVTGEVYGLRGARVGSMQFHPESLLTEDGPDILAEALTAVAAAQPITI